MIEDANKGKAKGGFARAESLTSEKRSEIAKKAAAARWENADIPVAEYLGEIKFTDSLSFPCAVLSNKTRVLTETDFMSGMGMYRSGALSVRRKDSYDASARMPLYLAFKNLEPFISKHLGDTHLKPLMYRTAKGGVGHGLPAEMIPKICEVWLDARKAGVLGSAGMDFGNLVPARHRRWFCRAPALLRSGRGAVRRGPAGDPERHRRDRDAARPCRPRRVSDTRTHPGGKPPARGGTVGGIRCRTPASAWRAARCGGGRHQAAAGYPSGQAPAHGGFRVVGDRLRDSLVACRNLLVGLLWQPRRGSGGRDRRRSDRHRRARSDGNADGVDGESLGPSGCPGRGRGRTEREVQVLAR